MTGNPPAVKQSIVDFKVSTIASNKISSNLLKFIDPAIEKLLGLDKIKKAYTENLQGLADTDFVNEAIKLVNAKIRLKKKELALIPKRGPVIIVCNHPYGGLDGIILYSMLKQVRPDFKIMANNMLKLFPELQEHFILVDAFNSNSKDNINPLKQAYRHLQSDGLLAVFPAGEVSRYEFNKKKVTDREWNDSVARLARMSGAQVVPVHFSGGNSLSFHIAGLIHPILRTMLLPRQMLKKDRKIHIRIGEPVKSKAVKQFSSSDELCKFLRLKTYLLNEKPKDLLKKRSKKKLNTAKYTHIGPPIDAELLKADIESLPEKNHLLDFKKYSVYYGNMQQLPNIILEIGRLRELTFRAVGEGSGKEFDLDKFDNHYQHLIVWNKESSEIVGSYRFAQVDKVMSKHGARGLYTSTFYKYSKDFKKKIHTGLELGRSFVRKEYQKQFIPLMLLWKGICRFVINNPQYHILFGAVSVSNTYTDKSRYLIANLLLSHSKDVKAKMKYQCRLKSDADITAYCKSIKLSTPDLLSNLIKGIEGDKDLPVLIKQYMKLGGQLHAFTVDDQFGDCMDGLIIVDLKESPPDTLKLYMDDHLEDYLKFHNLP